MADDGYEEMDKARFMFTCAVVGIVIGLAISRVVYHFAYIHGHWGNYEECRELDGPPEPPSGPSDDIRPRLELD